MKKLFILLTSALGICLPTYAQDPSISPDPGYKTWCPDETLYYEVFTTGAQQTGCKYKWTITKGEIIGDDDEQKVAVEWDDITDKGTLKVTLSNCTEATNTSKTEEYAIRSLKGKTPQNLRIQNGSALSLCSTNPLYIAVDRLSVPNTGAGTSIPQYDADGYEWQLSQSGAWNYSGNTEQITLTPITGCSAGTIRVRAYINSCSGLKYSEWTNPISLRSVPTLSLTTNGASSYTMQCGNTNSVTFTTTAISCANYTWTFPAGWRHGTASSPVTTSTNSITLTPLSTPANASGIPGNVIAVADLGCGTYSSSLSISYSNPALSYPVFTASSKQILCSNTSGTVAINTVSGAGSYTWYATGGNLYINNVLTSSSNPVVTTSTSVTVRSPVLPNAPGYGTAVRVKANRSNNCAGSTTRQREVWLGKPANVAAIGLGLDEDDPYYVCPNTIYQFNALDFTNLGAVTTYDWYTYNMHTIQSYNGAGHITANIKTGNQVDGTYISARAQNACGNSPYKDVQLFQSGVGCSGGGCGGFICGFSVSPNPASDYIELAYNEEKQMRDYEVGIYDSGGELMIKMRSGTKKLRIPTNNFKSGLYVMKIASGSEKEEHIIKIEK